MKDVKENSVQWTDWDSNRECFKHLSSTKLPIIIIASYQENALSTIHIKIHHSSLPNAYLGRTGLNIFTLINTTAAPSSM